MKQEELDALRRNSGLVLDRQGRFFYRGRLVENVRVQALFHSGLSVLPDGDVTLTIGEQWAFIECESVARFVDLIEAGDQTLTLRLLDGTEVVTDRFCLGFVDEGPSFVWFDTPHNPPAQLLFGAHHALAPHLEEAEDGRVTFALGGRHWAVVMLSESPGPGTPAPTGLHYSTRY